MDPLDSIGVDDEAARWDFASLTRIEGDNGAGNVVTLHHVIIALDPAYSRTIFACISLVKTTRLHTAITHVDAMMAGSSCPLVQELVVAIGGSWCVKRASGHRYGRSSSYNLIPRHHHHHAAAEDSEQIRLVLYIIIQGALRAGHKCFSL